MRKILVTLVTIASLLWAASSVQAAYVETFDTGMDSWKYGYGTDFSSPQNDAAWMSTGGNSGAHISGAGNNLYAIWTYDTAIYGDLTGLTMTIDTKVTDQEAGNAQFYVGRGGTYFIDGIWAIGDDTSWTTHTVALDATHFSEWTGLNDHFYTLAEVLEAPDDIGIFFGGTVASGAGNVLVDNFGTTVVPEPISSTLFIVGVATLGFRQFRKRAKM